MTAAAAIVLIQLTLFPTSSLRFILLLAPLNGKA